MHVDLDAFFASVEQTDHPEYAGKPVIVGARPGHRGVVSACSYEARVFGVHSAMPISQATRLCPDGVFLPVRMKRYQEVSHTVMEILARFTPDLRQMSVDEAFLDLTGTERLLGTVDEVAAAIKREVCNETKLAISVGVAPSRYLAKLASDFDKPDGLCIVKPGEEESFVAKLPLKALSGIGKKMISQLKAVGIETVVQLRDYSKTELAGHFGKNAADYLYDACRGRDPGFYSEGARSHSISGETTFERDVAARAVLEQSLLQIAHTSMFRLLESCAHSQTVTLKLRLSDFTTSTARKTLDHSVTSADEIFDVARGLLKRKWDGVTPVRLIGCGLGNVEHGTGNTQNDLFDQALLKRRKLEEAVYRLKRQGLSVKKARLLSRNRDEEEQ
jgi:DNA polymerase-4